MRFKLLTLAVSCVIALSIAELGAWIFLLPPTHPGKAVHDRRLGWRPRPNMVSDTRVKDSAGVRYRRRYTTTRDGFREFGDPSTTSRPKVLFIGDSFTQATAVSNADTYYRRIADHLDLELFAFGQSGYGTLQELLVTEAFLGEIRPDLIVLQVCDNDFIDNHVDLEREAGYNLGLRRPYMDPAGAVRNQIPAGPVVNLVTRSRFAAWLHHRSRRLSRSARRSTDAEHRIAWEGEGYPTFRDAVLVTGLILQRFREISGDSAADLLVFGATGYQPQLDVFRQLCEARRVDFSTAAVDALESAAADGIVVTAGDRVHWSPSGHAVVATALEPVISSRLD